MRWSAISPCKRPCSSSSRLFRDEENDRALAIVGGAFLDTLLENILIEFLVDDEKEVGELLQYDGPMGTYSGRIRAAYCLGLLRKTVRDDLRLVGKIRNRFAHDLSASFAEEPIRAGATRCGGTARPTWSRPPAYRRATSSMSASTSWSATSTAMFQLRGGRSGCGLAANETSSGRERRSFTGDLTLFFRPI